MKKNLLLLILLFAAYLINAAPFKFLPYSAEQPDGSIIECYMSGDEFFNWVHDEDGYSIKKGSDGYYYYATKIDDKIVASEYRVNSVNPEEVGISKWTIISREKYLAKRKKFEKILNAKGGSKAPHTGAFNNIVIYIRFSGESEISTTRQTYDDKLNLESGNSLKAYFDEVSYNQLTINSTHYPSVANPSTSNLSYEDSHERSYFQPYDASTNPNGYQDDDEAREREHQLLVDAITWINTNDPVPSSIDIDGDGDGYVDNVCFMIQGDSDEWSDLLWAHRWALYTQTININGKRVYDYTFQPENQVSVRTLCHEMFHALGAPDLYHYYNGEDLAPVSSWDIMEHGAGHMGAYMKWKYADGNWISTIPEITTDGTYTLNPLTVSTQNCYKIASPNSTSEYFVLEYRTQTGTFESELPGEGLLVYRINTDFNGNAGYDGSTVYDEVYIYRPGGTLTENGTPTSAHFSSDVSRTSINDQTDPNSFLSAGGNGGLNISNVTSAGSTISFDVSFTSETTLTGKVTDATTGNGIEGATVEIAGLSTTTTSDGSYSITGIPEEGLNADFISDVTTGEVPLEVSFTSTSTEVTHDVNASATGYETYVSTANIIEGQTTTMDISLSPTLTSGEMRIVLNWDDDPDDLDSHVKTPEIEGTSYHVYYGDEGSIETAPYVYLDVDDTDGYGPETITFYDFFTGTYNYYVYKYSGNEAITQSNAVVQLYDQAGLQYTIYVPTSGTGNYWHVFNIDGATGAVTVVNEITDTEPGWMDTKAGEEEKTKDITSYSWDFGDGSSSTEANPIHTYTSGGTYTVSLTVSNGSETNTETKTSYINVTGTAGGTLSGRVTDATTGAAVEGALVEVSGISDYTDASGNYEITGIPEGVLAADFIASITTGEAPLGVTFTSLSSDGAQIVTASATGYTTYTSNVSIPAGGSFVMDISLSPTLTTGEMRIVLNWDDDPDDLDSHVKTPEIEGTSYHVYYSDEGSVESAPYVYLDVDDTDGYGPETITFYDLFTGTYNYYVHKYSGNEAITQSNAIVQLYDQAGLQYTIYVPTSGTGNYWHVFNIDGATGAVTVVNEITDEEPGWMDKNASKATKAKDITSYSWNFGDGGTSTDANPTHTYNTAGTYTVSLTVSNGTTSDTETKTNYITVTEPTVSAGNIVGYVTNALDGTAVEGAYVEIASMSTYTDASGYYEITNVPQGSLAADFTANYRSGNPNLSVQFSDQSTEGAQTMDVTASGYIDYSNNQVIILVDQTVTMNISLSPTLSSGQMRLVLNWGESPSDLDSHLKTPEIEGSEYHVYYSNKGSSESAPFAILDYDVTSGYGPETMTFHQFYSGTYHYYIYNYSGSPDITTSSAVVQVYTDQGIVQTVQVPTIGTGRYWHVFDIDGSTKNLTLVNSITDVEPGTIFPNEKTEKLLESQTITSWNWSFGDGATSTEQNPMHTYTSTGVYTVSLTVSDGSSTNTETKTDFISIFPTDITDVTGNEQIAIYPNPSNGRITLKIDNQFGDRTTIEIQNIHGQVVYNESMSNAGKVVKELDLTNYGEGIYFVRVQSNDESNVYKIIVR